MNAKQEQQVIASLYSFVKLEALRLSPRLADDLVQEGLVAALRILRANLHDPQRATFLTWVCRPVRWSMISFLRKHSTGIGVATRRGRVIEVVDVHARDIPVELDPSLRLDVERVLATLPKRDRRIIALYLRGHSGADLGQCAGVTRKIAWQTVRTFRQLLSRPDLQIVVAPKRRPSRRQQRMVADDASQANTAKSR